VNQLLALVVAIISSQRDFFEAGPEYQSVEIQWYLTADWLREDCRASPVPL
jgi:hypothetical protein